ncbi:hypothetical protein Bca101_048155 [Brassica carinata]
MEQELRNLIKVWISAFISISYCYYISSRISKGFLRLLCLLPIFIIFLLIPLFFSSFHFCAISAFFLSWLANFKLALFAFDQEPLSPLPSTLSRFFCFACFPIKTNQTPSSNRIPMSKWVLRPTIHIPVQQYTARLIGPNLAFYAGVLATFLVSCCNFFGDMGEEDAVVSTTASSCLESCGCGVCVCYGRLVVYTSSPTGGFRLGI